MRALSKGLMLAAAVHFATIAAPSAALAQSTPSPKAPQPVPYGNPPPPVPYGQPAPLPATTSATQPVAAGGDVIYLKSGGILRGTIIDAIPNAQARIQLATGEIATVAWPDIQRIEHATQAPAPAAPAPTAAKPEKATSVVWVHIEGPEDARLQQDTTGNDDWLTVCTAPCDKEMPTAYYYRVVGDGIKASGEFTLHAQPGDHETLDVHGASKPWFVIGVVAIPIGLVVGYIGLIVGVIGSAVSSVDQSSQANNTAGVGWTMFGLGAGAAIGGLVLVIVNWKTGVSQQVGTPQTGLLLSDAWKRVPTWKDTAPEEKALPAAVGIPIFGGRF